MRYVDNLNLGKQVILERFPEFKGAGFKSDGSGWANFAIKVNDEYLFRFPRDDEALSCIQAECEVLDQLKPQLPNHIQVPNYLGKFLNQNYPFVYYKMIQGKPLTRETWHSLREKQREKFIDCLVEFLEILHNVNLTNCKIDIINPLDNYQKHFQEFEEKCFKYLNKSEKYIAEQLFKNYFDSPAMQDYKPAVIHHDLSENHILLTKTGIGVIDFGDTVIFDPAMDFTWIYAFDQELYSKLHAKYQSDKKDDNFIMRIRDFYLPIIPFYGIIYAEETKNDKLFKTELRNLKDNLAKLT